MKQRAAKGEKTSTKPAGGPKRGKARGNPLLGKWSTPFLLPPFEQIEPQHFAPAFAAALKEHKAEIAKIAGLTSRPTFANTIVALERAGRALNRVGGVFYNLTGAHTSEALQAVEREIAPQLAAHETAVMLNPKIFKRVEDLYKRRDSLRFDDEQRRVLELHHTWLVRAGAKLGRKAKARVAEINERLATLATQFGQNVLKDEQSWRMVLDGERDLAGLPASVRASAARAGADAGLKGKHVITLSRSSVEPFLQFSARRDLREQVFAAWTKRGEMGGTTDNLAITSEIVALRTELANLLGYASYADYSLDDAMAKTPAAVRNLLTAVWPAAVRRAAQEREALQQRVHTEGGNFEIAAWDWRYYSEKERKALYDLDEASTRPYFALETVIAAAFDTAQRLFGLRFEELGEVPRYHPDVRASSSESSVCSPSSPRAKFITLTMTGRTLPATFACERKALIHAPERLDGRAK